MSATENVSPAGRNPALQALLQAQTDLQHQLDGWDAMERVLPNSTDDDAARAVARGQAALALQALERVGQLVEALVADEEVSND